MFCMLSISRSSVDRVTFETKVLSIHSKLRHHFRFRSQSRLPPSSSIINLHSFPSSTHQSNPKFLYQHYQVLPPTSPGEVGYKDGESSSIAASLALCPIATKLQRSSPHSTTFKPTSTAPNPYQSQPLYHSNSTTSIQPNTSELA
jgi:hypothetical protein